MGEAWLFLSGKGGTGKSLLTGLLGQALARKGKRVCVVDGDIGLRSQDAVLGQEDRVIYDLLDVCRGDCNLEQALLEAEERLTLLPAPQMALPGELDGKRLGRILRGLKEKNDFVLVDGPSGLAGAVPALLQTGPDRLALVCTADDLCLRGAGRMGQMLEEQLNRRPEVIINRLGKESRYTAAVAAQVLDLPLLEELREDSSPRRERLKADVDRLAARLTGEALPLPGYRVGEGGFLRLGRRLKH